MPPRPRSRYEKRDFFDGHSTRPRVAQSEEHFCSRAKAFLPEEPTHATSNVCFLCANDKGGLEKTPTTALETTRDVARGKTLTLGVSLPRRRRPTLLLNLLSSPSSFSFQKKQNPPPHTHTTGPGHHRRRARRLRRRHQGRAARDEGDLRRRAGVARGHVPQRRLHPLQGASFLFFFLSLCFLFFLVLSFFSVSRSSLAIVGASREKHSNITWKEKGVGSARAPPLFHFFFFSLLTSLSLSSSLTFSLPRPPLSPTHQTTPPRPSSTRPTSTRRRPSTRRTTAS